MLRSIILIITCFLYTASFSQSYIKKKYLDLRSSQLTYDVVDSAEAISFYGEIVFEKKIWSKIFTAVPLRFKGGIFGFKIKKENEVDIIFNVKGNYENYYKSHVSLKAKGEGVIMKHDTATWTYKWKVDSIYKYYLHTLSDSATATTIYTGYLYLPELQKWKLLASYSVSNDNSTLSSLKSQVVFINSPSTINTSKIYFGRQWIVTKNGEWREITESTFREITGNSSANNFVAGTEGDQFYIAKASNGISIDQESKLSRLGSKKPVVDVTKNADSIVQWKKDKAEILSAVKAGKFDTTGSTQGVYYLILKQGQGNRVSITDTVTVHYKGSLLKDGSVFDETKGDDVVTFPLSRVIRGWQVGVSLLKVGGKIRLLIPSAMAYSIRSRSKDIPPNSVLVFDVEVLAVKKKV